MIGSEQYTKEGDSTDEDQSTKISAPDVPMDNEEKEIVKNQLQQRCISTH